MKSKRDQHHRLRVGRVGVVAEPTAEEAVCVPVRGLPVCDAAERLRGEEVRPYMSFLGTISMEKKRFLLFF